MRTVLWFIHFWVYLVFLIPRHRRAKKLAKEGQIEAHDALVRDTVGRWAKRMIKVAGGHVQVEGLENLPTSPGIYVGNHQSYFDIPLVLGYLGEDTKPLLARHEIKKIPLIRGWMEDLHCVFLHRDNAKEAMRDLNEAGEWVAKGYSMVIFPEGTRSKTGEVSEFKGGAFRIAKKNKVPVIPFCIKDTNKLMERDNLWVHPASVSLRILKPIDTSQYGKAEWKALPEMAEKAVRDGLKEM
ncbi:MAG: lysophospholipid acyltransferase family protein [Eubacteriaceae bacterium]